jgi:hypothetical protein
LRPSASAVYHIGVEHTAGPVDSVRLEVAGRPLDARGADLALIAGRYPFTLSVAVRDPAGVTRLRWSPRAAAPAGGALDADPVITPTMLLAPAQGTHGVTAAYRDGPDPAAPVTLRREEPSPSWFFFYTPFGVAPFVGEWTGTLLAPAGGRYAFDVDIGGIPALWLDDRPVPWAANGRSSLGVPLFHAQAELDPGPHRFRFQDRAPGWREPCFLFWTPPGGARALIPSTAFLPDLWSQETPHAP